MFSLSIQTLGCKLNQLESEAIAAAFKKEGFRLLDWGEAADIMVVNTCTVTSRAEQKARRTIRKALKENPRTCLIVTGCYAQLEAAAIAALETPVEGAAASKPRLFVVSGELKSALLDLPRFLHDAEQHPAGLPELLKIWSTGQGALPPVSRSNPFRAKASFRFETEDYSFHSRAFLKIQDGCDRACSYCRVALARGPSVSLGADQVLARLRALEERGYGEAVLTGVNLQQYRDLVTSDLTGLLEYLLRETNHISLRLSSLEPECLTPRFVEVLAHRRIRPHFHLSVQSGSPLVLAKMRRPYTGDEVERGVELLRSHKADPFLACDIITGFPGETEAEFEKTYELCKRIGFAWIHAFPYSRRPGTEAYGFKENVSEGDAGKRVDALLNLAVAGRGAYIQRWLGKTVEAVTETGDTNARYTPAMSENYLRLMVQAKEGRALPPPGGSFRCRMSGLPPQEAGEGPSRFDAIAEPVFAAE